MKNIHLLAYVGPIEVSILVQVGRANLAATGNVGWMALHAACDADHFHIVQWLVQEGNVNVKASDPGHGHHYTVLIDKVILSLCNS
jgi:Ankyrin repeat